MLHRSGGGVLVWSWMEVHVCKILNFVLQSASGRPSLVYKGRFPDPRLRDEDPGVRCSPPLR